MKTKTNILLTLAALMLAMFSGFAGATTTSCSIDVLKLWDNDANAPVPGFNPIPDGAVIDINSLPANYTLQAHVSGPVESVKFTVNGHNWTENVNPYRYGGDTFNWSPGPGSYAVTARAYEQNQAAGAVCDTEMVTFTIVDSSTGDQGCSRVVTNTASCDGAHSYSMWLEGNEHYTGSNFNWTEYSDGTARLTGVATHETNGSAYYVDLTYTGRSTTPDGDPKLKFCGTTDTTDWIYYHGLSGTLSRYGSSNAPIQITRRGPAFQMGVTANQNQIDASYGACGWFNTDDSTFTFGDINIQLSPECTPIDHEVEGGCTRVVTNTSSCDGAHSYSLWLKGGNFFTGYNMNWTEYNDGTARLTGFARAEDGGPDAYAIDITYGGASSQPDGDPKLKACGTTYTTGWTYYHTIEQGTLTRAFDGHVINISRRGPAFQMGVTANERQIDTSFGACGWFNTDDATFADGDINIQLSPDCINVDPTPGAEGIGIGNLVFEDNDGNGIFDPAVDAGIDGVAVQLFDANNPPNSGAAPLAEVITADGGCYYFGNLAAGDYIVHIPADQFGAGNALGTKISSTGNGSDDGADDDMNENGVDQATPAIGGISSMVINLTAGTEPTESGKDAGFDDSLEADNDLTIDFGFTSPGVGIGNLVFEDNDGDGTYDDTVDAGIDGVLVELYAAGSTPGVNAPVASTYTYSGGCYYFGALVDGQYFVHIPASQFGAGVLGTKISSTGADSDNGVDDLFGENGLDTPNPAASGVSSVVIDLLAGNEPTDGGTENGKDIGFDNADDDNNDLTVDFGFTSPGVGIGNLVFEDNDGNGAFDPGIDSGLDGITVELYEAGSGTPLASTVTHSGGCYYFGALLDGDYVVVIPADQFAAGGPLVGKVSSAGSGADNGVDDSADENGIDTPNPASTGISSGIITLLAGNEPKDNEGENGKDAAGDNIDDDNNDFTVDFGVTSPGVGIGNLIFQDENGDGAFDPATDSGVDGVTVELYAAGDQPGVDTPIASTVTHDGGCYYFSGLNDGGYIVHVPASQFAAGAALAGLYSSAGDDGDSGNDDDVAENGIGNGDPAINGVSTAVIALAAGNEPTGADSETGKDASADNGDDDNSDLTIDLGFFQKEGTFAGWQLDFPLGGENGPSDNPDGDIYSNALEYALCLKPGEGTSETLTGGTGGFCTELNATSGEVDALFTRAAGGFSDVTYTLQTATALADPTAWTDRTDLTPVVTDNGDGSEEVRFTDLESAVAATGFTRLKVEIAGDSTGPHFTQAFGWNTMSFLGGCQTAGFPYAPKSAFSGTAAAGDFSGGALDVSAAGGDFDQQLDSAEQYYIEFIDGAYEGHRFDIDEAGSNYDTALIDAGNARNTLDPVPADLAGAYEVRAHITLDDVADPNLWVPTLDSATGDRALFFNGTTWTTYWVTDINGLVAPQWTRTDDGSLGDSGSLIIDPCQGYFLHPKGGTVDVTLVGIVRSWDFACPLQAGFNMTAGGYPVDMSPASRAMKRDDGDGVQDWFNGTNDPATADQINTWVGDNAIGSTGYESYFRLYLGIAGFYDHWTSAGQSDLASAENDMIFEAGRAAFINSTDGHDTSDPADVWIWPAPWTP